MITDAATKLEAFARELAPTDLAGTPVYIALESDGLPHEFCPSDQTRAFAGKGLDIALRGWLADRWCGRGSAVVILNERLRSDVNEIANDDRDLSEKLFKQRLDAILAHELAHTLDLGIDRRPVVDDVIYKLAIERTTTFCQTPATLPTDSPWRGHEQRFMRAVLHLAHRSKLLGVELPLNLIFDAGAYGLSSIWSYQQTLGDEPALCIGKAFGEILAQPAPARFSQLFADDVSRYRKSH